MVSVCARTAKRAGALSEARRTSGIARHSYSEGGSRLSCYYLASVALAPFGRVLLLVWAAILYSVKIDVFLVLDLNSEFL